MTASLTMAQSAAEVGVHYDTFRKNWRAWRKALGFPSPYLDKPFRWRPEALGAWKLGREASAAAAPPPIAANDRAGPAASANPRLAAQRDELLAMMG